MYFCNINFNTLNKNDIFERNHNEGVKCIATANAQFIVLANNNKRFLDFLNDNYVTFDGEIPLKVARFLNKGTQIEKISGSDLVYDFCEYAKCNDLSLFFLGGSFEAVGKAVMNVKRDYEIRVGGFSPRMEDYPFSESFISECKMKIIDFKPDIIFVGFGAPKQEFFIDDLKDFWRKIGVKYIIGSGGTVDFVAGTIKRAPKWVQKCGLEGLYRFVQEPSKKRLNRLTVSLKFFRYIR